MSQRLSELDNPISKNFHKVIGFDLLWQRYLELIQREVFPQVSLITGREGIGKSMFASKIGAAHLCLTGDACGSCESCRAIESNTHPEFMYVSAAESRLTLDDVKPVQDFLDFNPGPFLDSGVESTRKTWRIVIIEDFHKLNLAGQNRLLKTLEEPPGFARIILTTSEPQRILPTIHSRVVEVKLTPPDKNESVELLTKLLAEKDVELSRDDIELAIERFGLSPGAALAQLMSQDESIVQLRQLCDSLIMASHAVDVLSFSEQIAALKVSSQVLVDELDFALHRLYSNMGVEARSEKMDIIKRRRTILSDFRKRAVLKGITLNNQLLCEAVGMSSFLQ